MNYGWVRKTNKEYWNDDIEKGITNPDRKRVKSYYLTNYAIMKIVEEARKIGLTPSSYMEQLIRSQTNERRSP